ncbi:phosphoribosylanthranilate isomerase [Ruminococcus sp.]|uniref:phosphoribosylanthranilate isomerase n=1 Tax=Ruminococcus sp. TaxID=41978 RepID=UPI0026259F57|nr:phosphoribosylanthranilate isomerase [Ruminococcus sp.]MDD6988168.1 phosphoribosylanthranilate isomerase [Ruminococcus sp.]MDY6200931.1 phosphoribosylanthranilate isomerase [Ruminococcus sp.]
MTKIKLCGLSRNCDIDVVNKLKPDFIGFVFWQKSSRFVTKEKAFELKSLLNPDIKAVGVFVDEKPETVAELLNLGIIDMAQLHGSESEEYIEDLKKLSDKPIIKAFRVKTKQDIIDAQKSSADYVLLDSGAGTGNAFDWELIQNIQRPYFLAGGLDTCNAETAVKKLKPYAVDVSSGIETNRLKDKDKMMAFVVAVRNAETK